MDVSKINFSLRVGVFSLTALLLAGCIYIPTVEQQFSAEETQQHLVIGSTTKDDMFHLLGPPNVLESETFFVYKKSHDAGLLLFFGSGYGGGVVGGPLSSQDFFFLLSFDENGILKRYEMEGAREFPPIEALPVNESNILFEDDTKSSLTTATIFEWVAFSQNGKVVAAGDSKDRVWIQYLGTPTRFIRKTDGFHTLGFALGRLAVSPDGTQLALLRRSVEIIDVATGNTLIVYRGHGDAYFWAFEGATCLAFHPLKPLVATGGENGLIKTWNPATGAEALSFKGHDHAISSIAYSPDGRLLATAGEEDRKIKIWDSETKTALATLPAWREYPPGFARFVVKFSPGGDLLAINTGTQVELWRVAFTPNTQTVTTELLDVLLLPNFNPEPSIPLSLDFSSDGRLVAASNGAAVVFDIFKQQKLLRVTPTEGGLMDIEFKDVVHALAFSPDDKELAVATLSGVYLWQLPKKAEQRSQQSDAHDREKE